MNRSTIISIVVGVVIIAILGYLLNDRINKLKDQTAQREAAERKIAELEAQLKNTRQTMQSQIEDLDKALVAAGVRQTDTERKLQAMTEGRQAAEKSLAETQKTLVDMREQLERTAAELRDRERTIVELQRVRDDLSAQIASLLQKISELEKQILILERQLAAGGVERDRIEKELVETRREKEALLAQWNSLKAVHDRLIKIREEQRQAEIQKREEEKQAIEKRKREIGNRGYFVKDGKNTFNKEAWELFRPKPR